MFDIKVTNEQYNFAKDLVSNYNFGQRGYGDGNRREQLTGLIGQTVFADLLKTPRPDGSTGFDNGTDFIINNKKVDIKTMSRKVSMKDHYVHNFIGYQRNYDVDYYIFASLNTAANILTVCGCIQKDRFRELASFYNKGDLRYRDDGTSFPAKAPLYEILQSDLVQVKTLEELLHNIR